MRTNYDDAVSSGENKNVGNRKKIEEKKCGVPVRGWTRFGTFFFTPRAESTEKQTIFYVTTKDGGKFRFCAAIDRKRIRIVQRVKSLPFNMRL